MAQHHGLIQNHELLLEQQLIKAKLRKLEKQVRFKRPKITPKKTIGYLRDAARSVQQQPIQNNGGGAMSFRRGTVINRFNQPPIIRRQPEQFEAVDKRQPLHNHFEHHSPDVYDDGDGIYIRFFDVEHKLKNSAKNTGSLFGF